MKTSEIRAKSIEELNAELLASLREQFNLKIQHGSGQLAKTFQLKSLRRRIATIKTILKEKGLSV